MPLNRSLINTLLRASVDDAGLYPASTVIDGQEKLRTPWEDGWNQAVMSITQKWNDAIGWFKALDEHQQDILQTLLDHSVVELSCDEKTWHVVVITNDWFGYGADSEQIELNQLEELHHAWTQHQTDGVLAWIAHTHGWDPLAKHQSHKYLQARQDLDFRANPPAFKAS